MFSYTLFKYILTKSQHIMLRFHHSACTDVFQDQSEALI